MTVGEADILLCGGIRPAAFSYRSRSSKNTVFKGLAASGWHTMALTMRMIVDCAKLAGGIVGYGAEISWPGPVRPGDELSVECEIIAITPSRSKPNQAVATLRTETKNQKGETVQVLTSKNLVFKRGHAPGDGILSRLVQPEASSHPIRRRLASELPPGCISLPFRAISGRRGRLGLLRLHLLRVHHRSPCLAAARQFRNRRSAPAEYPRRASCR